MRYLFVTVDSAGALYPQLALAQRLERRGHDVRFLGCRSQRAAISRAGFRCETYTGAPDFDMADPNGAVKDWVDDPHTSFTTCCDVIWFGPATAVAADVLASVDREPVDAIVIDYFAFGAAAAAERLDLPSAILWHTTYGEWTSWDDAGLPAINAARAGLGLPPDHSVYAAYRRARRILALSTEAFAGPQEVPDNFRYVGPQLPPGQEPPAHRTRAGDQAEVLVCLGTSYQAQEGLLAKIISALGQLPVHALVTTGDAIRHEGDRPANVDVVKWVAHSEVLPSTDLVITHCGLGTVMTALAFGVPLLCAPVGRDQHGNAARVRELGYGITVEPSASISGIRDAIGSALADRALAERAQAAGAACAEGFDAGAIELEHLGADTSVEGA
jgi:MGT family glycosyltransferase